MSGLGEVLTGLAMIVVVAFAAVLLVLLILMPWYIYKIYHEITAIRKNTDQLLEQSQLSNHKINQIINAYQATSHDP